MLFPAASTSSTTSTTIEFPEIYPVPVTPPRPCLKATRPLPRPAAPKSKPQVAASAPDPSGSGSGSSSSPSSESINPTSSGRKRKRADENDVDLTEARLFRRKILRVAEAAEKLSDSMYEWADQHALENGLDLETDGESSEHEWIDSTSSMRY